MLGQIGRALGLSFVRPQIEALATPGNDGLPASKVRYDLSPVDVREAVFAGILVPVWGWRLQDRQYLGIYKSIIRL